MAEGFTCDVDEYYRSACADLPKYEDTGYCVLHEPGEEKNKEEFLKVKKRKLDRKDYDFGGTVFPEGTADFEGFQFDANANFRVATFYSGEQTSFLSGKRTSFSRAQFSGEETSFSGAEFSGELTNFVGAEFSGERTDFSEAQFSGELTFFSAALFWGERASFSGAEFSGKQASFSVARFSGGYTDFSGAQFRSAETDFREATFVKEVDFAGATFSEKVAFRGSKAKPVFGYGAWAWFNRCRIEKPEQFTFNTVLLHPCWFINADVRKVDFTDVAWYGMPGGPKGTLNGEIAALEKRGVATLEERGVVALEERGVGSPYTLLAQACRRLSANAEENREYPLANEFHYWAMDAVRKGSWRRFKGLTSRSLTKKETWRDIGEHFGLITTLYWALSGYGVRAARAFWVLMGMWAMFTTLYVLVNPSEFKDFGQSIGYLWQTAVYSLLAMARLNPEPTPGEPGLFQFLVGLEGILGPLQIALLAFAIRRKVMR